MKYNELVLKRQTKTHRVGRGIAAGRGKTAGRGTKGQGARKSGGTRPGFEGGQTPLYMKIPKLRGFRSFHQNAAAISLSQLELIRGAEITIQSLVEAKLINYIKTRVKVVASGELKTKKTVRLPAASAKAIESIKQAGGEFIETGKRPVTVAKKPSNSPSG